MRPRAGYAWSAVKRGTRYVPILFDGYRWVHTFAAKGWPRCSRCRKPFPHEPFEGQLCACCHYRSPANLPNFWSAYAANEPWHPYRVGERTTSPKL